MERTVRVRILDREYLIRSDGDEAQVQEIAAFVDRRFREIRERTEGLSDKKSAILVAFHIAGEYFQLLEERDRLVREIQDRAKALNSQIDALIG